MSNVGCALHGCVNCTITGVYKPFDPETSICDEDPAHLYAAWRCNICAKSGMSLLWDIYSAINPDGASNFVSNR